MFQKRPPRVQCRGDVRDLDWHTWPGGLRMQLHRSQGRQVRMFPNRPYSIEPWHSRTCQGRGDRPHADIYSLTWTAEFQPEQHRDSIIKYPKKILFLYALEGNVLKENKKKMSSFALFKTEHKILPKCFFLKICPFSKVPNSRTTEHRLHIIEYMTYFVALLPSSSPCSSEPEFNYVWSHQHSLTAN